MHFYNFAILTAGIILAGLILLSASFRRRCVTLFKQAKFGVSYPFVMIAYLHRKRLHWKKVIPPLWLSSGELLSRDLELYVTGEGKDAIDSAFIDGLAKARDETSAIVKKQLIVSLAIFVFLFANFLAIGVDVNIGGFSLKYANGILEGLLLISNLLSVYTLLLQSNVYLMESAIKFLVGAVLPAELKQLYLIKYFPHEHFGAYAPFNLPHIVHSKLTSTLNKYTALIFLLLLIPTYIVYFYCYILLVLDLWVSARLGVLSKAIAIYIFVSGVYGLLFLAITRVRLRYLDYTTNHEIELLRQVAPQRVNARLQEIYGAMNADRQDLVNRGYLKD